MKREITDYFLVQLSFSCPVLGRRRMITTTTIIITIITTATTAAATLLLLLLGWTMVQDSRR